MPLRGHSVTPQSFSTFGDLLRYLRERAEITQRELALQVGYHYSYLSRVERNERLPNVATILARFVPALHLEHDSEWVARLVELAAGPGQAAPANITISQVRTESPAEAVPAPGSLSASGSAPASRPALPALLTPLLGREAEIAAIALLLGRPDVRILTLAGPPGIGKTRLALQVARDLAPQFTHGAAFIDLAGVKDPALLAPVLIQHLGLHQAPGESPEATLREALQDQRRLLVLDNFEQIIPAGPVVSRLLQAAPGVKALVTSREILRLNGENEFQVPPLPVEAELGAPAVELFCQRARAVQPSFRLTDENAATIARLCTRLDGLPLAIEIAAARIKLFTPEAMLARLDQRLNWLTGGRRDDHAWRQTLRGAIDWSYQLLTGEEKDLFASLSVFGGGGTLAAVEAVCGAGLDELAVLSEKSLIQLIPAADPAGDLRFTWLESLREYAAEILAGRPDLHQRMAQAHADYFQAVAEQTGEGLVRSRSSAGLSILDAELDNLRAALSWAIAGGQGGLALSLCVSLLDYWEIRGQFEEGRRWLSAALRIAALEPSVLLGRAYRGMGWLASRQTDLPESIAWYRRAVEVWQALGDEAARANALVDLGMQYRNQYHRIEERFAIFREALAAYTKLNDPRGISLALNQIGTTAFAQGDYPAALENFQQSLALRRSLGDRIAISGSLNNLGVTAYAMGDYAGARRWHQEALALRQELGFDSRLGQSRLNLALAALRLGDAAEAEENARLSLEIGVNMKLKANIVEAVEALGMIAAVHRKVDRAACLLGAAGSLRKQLGIDRDPMQQQSIEWAMGSLAEVVHASAWQAAWQDGEAMGLYQAAEEAMAG